MGKSKREKPYSLAAESTQVAVGYPSPQSVSCTGRVTLDSVNTLHYIRAFGIRVGGREGAPPLPVTGRKCVTSLQSAVGKQMPPSRGGALGFSGTRRSRPLWKGKVGEP